LKLQILTLNMEKKVTTDFRGDGKKSLSADAGRTTWKSPEVARVGL